MAAAEIGVPASTAATGRDAADPTMPYRYPFGPLPRKQRMAATRVAAMGPPVPAPTLDELQDVRARAAALAEEERFSQAAEALEAALRSAVGDYGAKHPKLLELRLDFANMLVLGGDYRRALPQFERLAGYLAERLGSDDELVWYCRQQAATCQAELGDATHALRSLRALLTDQALETGADSPDLFPLRHQIAVLTAGVGEVVTPAGNSAHCWRTCAAYGDRRRRTRRKSRPC